MPKALYFRLSEKKRNRIDRALGEIFAQKDFRSVTVREIVETLGIARGSFYQYFDSLEESYFYILDRELTEMHRLFLQLLQEREGRLFEALDAFGEAAAPILYAQGTYQLYRSRYLCMDGRLEAAWQAYERAHSSYGAALEKTVDHDRVAFIQAVVHHSIQRLFAENWDQTTFLAHYRQNVQWMKEGIGDGTLDGSFI